MTSRHALGDLLGALVKVIPSRAGLEHLSVMGKAGDALPALGEQRSGRVVSCFHASALVERVACDSTTTRLIVREAYPARDTAQPTAERGCQAPGAQADGGPCRPDGSSGGLQTPPAERGPGSFTLRGREIHFRGVRKLITAGLDAVLAVEVLILAAAIIRNFWS